MYVLTVVWSTSTVRYGIVNEHVFHNQQPVHIQIAARRSVTVAVSLGQRKTIAELRCQPIHPTEGERRTGGVLHQTRFRNTAGKSKRTDAAIHSERALVRGRRKRTRSSRGNRAAKLTRREKRGRHDSHSTLACTWTQKSTCTVHWTFPRTTTMAGMTDMWCIRLTLVSCSTSICRAFGFLPPSQKNKKEGES